MGFFFKRGQLKKKKKSIQHSAISFPLTVCVHVCPLFGSFREGLSLINGLTWA